MEETIDNINEDVVIMTCPNPVCGHRMRVTKHDAKVQFACPQCRTFMWDGLKERDSNRSIPKIRQLERDRKLKRKSELLLEEFDIALEEEIETLKKQGGERTLVLKEGKFIGEIANGSIYQFNIERKIPVADETPAQIEIMGRNYRASIIRFLEFKLEIRIIDLETDEIPFAILKIDSTYVLRRLKDVLSSLSQGARENSLPLKVFNYISPSCSIAEPDFILYDTDKHTLDNYQMNAIKACLGSEVCFVHGPPGTGKTMTLVNLVNECTNSGKKILVSCHTNIACDNVLDQFIKYSHEKMVENMLDRGEIIRIGTPVLQNSKVKELTIEAIYERLDKGLQIEKESLSHLIYSLTKKNQEYLEFKQIFLELEMLRERIDHCEENITKSKGIIHKCMEAESKLNQAISEKRELLAIAENRNAVINLVRRTRPKDIKQLIILLSIQKMEEHKVRRKEEQRLELLSGEFDKISSSFTEKSGRLPAGIGLEQINDELEQTNSDLGITKKKANELDKKISELNERIIDEAKVVVATLTKTFTDPILINMQFDMVVVDEVSIAPLPMLFYVSTMAKDKVSIFGDPKQLAPIGLSDKSHAKKWLRQDIFQEADATEFKENDPRIQSLNNQYRMHRDIFRIVNNYFYGNLFNRKTENGPDDVYGRLFPKSKQRVAIVDTSDANACMSTERMGPKSNSRYNVYHIQIIERILHDLFDGQQIEEKDVGIITPYRSQASFIRAMLVELGLKNIDVGTVHSFQGLERQYMIFDLVEAPGGKRISGLINDKHELYLGKSSSENEALRLNTVAFSRAREKLIIVSHNKYMLNNLPGDSVIRKIVVDLIDSGSVISGSNLVPYYVPEEDYPDVALVKQEELFDKEAVFNQKSFYKHLIQDLESAEKEVIFISGYMTSNRMGKLMPHLVKLLSRGVNVKVFTKPPREQLSRV